MRDGTLEVSQYLYHGLTDYGILGLLYKFIHAMQAKPPLVSLLPVPMYLLFGNHAMGSHSRESCLACIAESFPLPFGTAFLGRWPCIDSCISLQPCHCFRAFPV